MSEAIDGRVALAGEMKTLALDWEAVRNAPVDAGLSTFLARGIPADGQWELFGTSFWDLTVLLIQRLSIWWPPEAAAVLPSMTPWCIRDRSARYQYGEEQWGAPRHDGYFRDDSSIIKKLPLPLRVSAPDQPAYDRKKPLRGFTACHIWRELSDGSLCGTDPILYSFMPNLVWLPSPLAPLTDHNPQVRHLLQETSARLFAGTGNTEMAPYINYAWSRLIPESVQAEASLELDRLAFFMVDRSFLKRRIDYISAFTTAATIILEGGTLERKVVCSRYTDGMARLEYSALERFREQLELYGEAASHAVSAWKPE